MISLSTSWNSAKHDNGFDLIREVKDTGFDSVELNFALTPQVIEDILTLQLSGQIKVSSLHNMCPLPGEIDPRFATPDYYNLSSQDEAERRLAVDAARNTIDYAKKFGAKAIVLHAGRVEIKDRTRELASLSPDTEKFAALRAQMVSQRLEKRQVYLDSVMKSLEEIVPYAVKKGVAVGIENRYYYAEIPIMDEMELIFSHFGEGEIYYWHDVGHAEVFDRLGLCPHRDLLDRFSARLIGIHLHDIIGLVNDHKSPGQGAFDFSTVTPYIRPDTILVMEVHQPATANDIRAGRDTLLKIFGKAR
ncbi:MAG: sugar phosphate isomerase/epimerase [Candidatus Omnitrophica bacterium]|nr:sugar phosphate isomerase/epimerase [Candidatus Omnitrophota bacterium]